MGALFSKWNGDSKNNEEMRNETASNDSPEISEIRTVNGQQRIPYDKTSGAARMSGHLYEIYISMYFLLQGKKMCNENKIKDFFLATNLQGAGALDDVVFNYRYEDQSGAEKTKVVFLQAKHRDKPEKDKLTLEKVLSHDYKKEYQLKTYFNTYRKIKDSFNEKKPHPIFGCKFEECELVFFTNTVSSFSDCDQNIEKIQVVEDDIPNIGKNKYYYKLKLGGDNEIKIMDHLNNLSTYKILAKHLAECIFCNDYVDVSDGVMSFYQKKLAEEVIEETERGKGKFRESFLIAENEDPFKQFFLDEIQNRGEFPGHSKGDVISYLASKNFHLPKNFGRVLDKERKPTSSNDIVGDEEIEHFLSRFEIFANQPNEKELSEIIKKDIQTMFAVEDSDIESVFSEAKAKVENWWKDENYFLTKENKFYEESARVSVWFDVRNPVELFTGREEELLRLHEAMQRSQENNNVTIISQTTSVSGLGGIGKSELARKYIQLHSNYYEGNIVWINAENYGTLCESFRRLAQNKLRIRTETIEGKSRDIETIVEEVFQFFSKRRSLFVFDNAQKYKSERGGDEVIAPFMPSAPPKANKPYILITSRNQFWGNIKVLSLTTFTEKEATDFIRNALKCLESEENEIKLLAETLQYFPLALQQAVAYIREANEKLQIIGSRFCIRDYIQKYKKETEKLLDYIFPDESSDLYTRTTFTTWTITTDKILENVQYGEQAIMVLRIIAYLSENSIPVEILKEIGESEDKDEQLGNVLYILKQHSIIDITEGLVNVHKLVQEVTRINTRKENKEFNILSKTFEVLKSSAKSCSDTVDDAPRMRVLLPHLENLLSHIDSWILKESEQQGNLERLDVEYLLREMGRMYEMTGNPWREEELLHRTLRIQEKYLDADDPRIFDTLTQLAISYYNLGEIVKQNDVLERALKILETRYDPDRSQVAIGLENVGKTFGDLDQNLGKRKLLERALQVLEKQFSPDHFLVGICIHALGLTYVDLGKYLEGKILLERALQVLEKHYGPDHFQVAVCRQNLGHTYKELGNPLEGKKLLEKALQVQEKYYGPDSVAVGLCRVNLGHVYGQVGIPLEGKTLLQRSLQLLEKYYGPDHFKICPCLANLGYVYGELGEPLEGIKFLERGLQALEKYYGPDHFRVGLCLVNLGYVYGQLRKPLEGKKLLERALKILEKYYGPDHFKVGLCLVNLGYVYGQLGKPLEGKIFLERALLILEEHYGSDHFEVAICLQNLGYVHGQLGKHLEGKALIERALQILETFYGPDYFKVGLCLVNLGYIYGQLGKPLEGKTLLERALRILEEHYGSDHFEVGICLKNIGKTYRQLGNHLEEKKFIERGLKILEKHYGSDEFEVGICPESYVKLAEK